MDFSRLTKPSLSRPATNPREIFARLPRMEAAPNDLWHGQATALDDWNTNRAKRDVLLSLNTGSGKTIIGLLIAQSLVNEGVQNVVYCCPTIDLVKQTSREAQRIGIKYSQRVEGDFDNDLFESGNAFCITTYQALLNGHSSLRKKFFPNAIIFDDAHVAESMIRDALTLRIEIKKHRELLLQMASLFEAAFEEVGFKSRFREAVYMAVATPTLLLTPPKAVRENSSQLASLLERHNIRSDQGLRYAYEYLRDRLDRLAVVFGPGVCEITPAFLPSLALDIFERPNVRRVYLSATIRSKTEFIRAFGRKPDAVVAPAADAGNGERLILFARGLATQKIDPGLVSSLATKNKILIAVPNYKAADRWAACNKPPEPANFTERLDAFRKSSIGTFILVQRTDGIDLPHNACRVMVIDGLPTGASVLERLQYEILHMNANHASRMANRIVQLFGRINRGRNDYGIFLINDRHLNAWLNNHRHVALLPPLLQKQILLGRQVQEGMGITTHTAIMEIVDQVLSRNQSWLDYYGQFLDGGALDEEQVNRANEIETALEVASEAEARFAAALWEGDFDKARRELEQTVDGTGRADALTAGWHYVWLGACYDALGEGEAARLAFRDARSRLGSGIGLPIYGPHSEPISSDSGAGLFARSVFRIVILGSNEGFNRRVGQLRTQMRSLDGATPSQMEEAVRVLGEVLGLSSRRPDNDESTGPDVLWADDEAKVCLGFELKTDKQAPGRYSKKEIAQGHDHLSYIRNNLPGYKCLGLIYVGPEGECLPEANPSEEMWLTTSHSLAALRDQVLSMISDCRNALPIERHNRIREVCDSVGWNLEGLATRLQDQPLLR